LEVIDAEAEGVKMEKKEKKGILWRQ